MKILKLRLVNIKCFKEIEIPFEFVGGGARNWSLLVGDNGQGKTTILRSLAMGLCDEDGAASLLPSLHGEFLRWNKKEGSIEICLEDSGGKKYTIRTCIRLEGNKETISQDIFRGDRVGECDRKNDKSKIKKFKKRKDIFAVAYGAGRSVSGTKSYEEYTLVDALDTLFNYEQSLQDAELGARRIRDRSEGEWGNLRNILKKILMMEEDEEISLEITGLYIKTRHGKGVFGTMSDGYKSLTSVVVDFLCWNQIHRLEDFSSNNLSGIFIIDELEQHLHPRWQRKIIKILSDQFPKVQFVCSTHTPICALGLIDLECESRLFKVAYENNHSEVNEFDLREEFKGYRSDQILTSRIFDLTDTRSAYIEDRLEKYAEIYLKEKDERGDPSEEKLFLEIEEELKDLPMWDNVQEKMQRAELIKLLKNQTDES